MSNNNQDLQTLETSKINSIIAYAPEHSKMLEVIRDNLPEIQRATSLFGKGQSQFMDNMLTVAHTTPVRNLRQILAEIEKSKMALKESYFKQAKKDIEICIKQRDLDLEKDDLKRQLAEIEISEMYSQKESSQIYISGAIRAITNYIEQYNSILASMGVTDFNEIDFEQEEEKYHIQKAFEQGVTAARSRQGIVDEGNMIYFTQIGINGAAAQRDVMDYLVSEGKLLADKEEPTHQMFLDFLNKSSEKYKGCSSTYAKAKGMTGKISEIASLKTGDLRLIKNKEIE